jgi:FKBP-type peptidyl-prolyl cis-trans isomerase 2
MTIKKNDYIEVTYTGKIKGEDTVFDTTDADVAKKSNFYDAKVTYKPVVVCIGKHHLIKGLDEQIVGKTMGKYTFQVKDVDGFGKKDPKLLKLMPISLFNKEQVKPFPGLEVNIDDNLGIVKNVSGGRVIVDFNHPLASKDLEYDIEIIRIVDSTEEKIKAYLDIIRFPYLDISIEGDTAKITTPIDVPDQIQTGLIQDLTETTGIKTIEFRKGKKESEKKEESSSDGPGEKKGKEANVDKKIDIPHEHNHDHPHEHRHDHNHEQ